MPIGNRLQTEVSWSRGRSVHRRQRPRLVNGCLVSELTSDNWTLVPYQNGVNTQHALVRGRLCQAFTMPYQLQSPKGRRKLRPATERLAYCRDSHNVPTHNVSGQRSTRMCRRRSKPNPNWCRFPSAWNSRDGAPLGKNRYVELGIKKAKTNGTGAKVARQQKPCQKMTEAVFNRAAFGHSSSDHRPRNPAAEFGRTERGWDSGRSV
jgi:hypothetical protein